MRYRIVAAGLLSITALSGCRSPTDGPDYRPVASVDQVMDGIVIPSSEAIFDAVVYENGALTQSPGTDDDWFRLQLHALTIAEAGNLLMIPGRAKDSGDWLTLSRAMIDAGETVARATDLHDIDGLLQAGGELYQTCVRCHEQYLAP